MIKKLIAFKQSTLNSLKIASEDRGLSLTALVRSIVIEWLKNNKYL